MKPIRGSAERKTASIQAPNESPGAACRDSEAAGADATVGSPGAPGAEMGDPGPKASEPTAPEA